MDDVPNTITRALTLCRVLADTNSIIFDGSNASERIANNVFNDIFNTCTDLKCSYIDEHWNRGFTEIGYVPKSRVIFKKNR